MPFPSAHRGSPGSAFPGPVQAPMQPGSSSHSAARRPADTMACLPTRSSAVPMPSKIQTKPPVKRLTVSLVDTLHGRHGLALVLVQGGANDTAVPEVDLAVRLLLPAERVLHPVDIVTVRVVLAGVGATRLLPVGGRGGRLGAVIPMVSASGSRTHPRCKPRGWGVLTRK